MAGDTWRHLGDASATLGDTWAIWRRAAQRGDAAAAAELRDAGGHRLRQPAPGVPLLLPPLEALVGAHPGLQLERKSVAVAVHYRAVPHLEGMVRNFAAQLAGGVPGIEVLHGKMVVELKPAGIDKGGAIDAFMRSPPFARRMPLFAGDDITDEAGFAVVRRLGGIGLLVGARPSAATASPPPASTPPTISGVPSSLNSGPGPRLSVLKRQATSSSSKLDASIWSSGA